MIRIHNTFGMRETFDVLKRCGYEAIDFNNDVSEYCSEEHGEDFYRELANHAEEVGIAISQAHAPFPSSCDDEEKNAEIFKRIVTGMKNAAALGAPMIVVHPCVHLDFDVEGNPERLFEYNLNFYKSLIPYAEKFGIKIAIENICRDSITSTPERLNRLYDALDNPVFTICFDVGHARISGLDPADAIRRVGKRLIGGCTHFHDNNGEGDGHTLPFYGAINWEEVMKALAEIGYDGNLNYEASNFIKDIPTELYIDGFTYMARVGKYLVSRFEHYKTNK
jgi:hexulose-6-phosphate isomerase